MDDQKKEMLCEHLPYELDMLDAAYRFLHSAEDRAEREQSRYKTNSAIEVFWLHARNLDEFVRYNSGTAIAAAEDFTSGWFRHEMETRDLVEKMNDQICHLKYGRVAGDQLDKLRAHDRDRAKAAIDRAIEKFQKNLTPEAKKLWKVREPLVIDMDVTADSSASSTIVDLPMLPLRGAG
jgi:hypothetical protein